MQFDEARSEIFRHIGRGTLDAATLGPLLDIVAPDARAELDLLVRAAEAGVPRELADCPRPSRPALRARLRSTLRDAAWTSADADRAVQLWSEVIEPPAGRSPNLGGDSREVSGRAVAAGSGAGAGAGAAMRSAWVGAAGTTAPRASGPDSRTGTPAPEPDPAQLRRRRLRQVARSAVALCMLAALVAALAPSGAGRLTASPSGPLDAAYFRRTCERLRSDEVVALLGDAVQRVDLVADATRGECTYRGKRGAAFLDLTHGFDGCTAKPVRRAMASLALGTRACSYVESADRDFDVVVVDLATLTLEVHAPHRDPGRLVELARRMLTRNLAVVEAGPGDRLTPVYVTAFGICDAVPADAVNAALGQAPGRLEYSATGPNAVRCLWHSGVSDATIGVTTQRTPTAFACPLPEEPRATPFGDLPVAACVRYLDLEGLLVAIVVLDRPGQPSIDTADLRDDTIRRFAAAVLASGVVG